MLFVDLSFSPTVLCPAASVFVFYYEGGGFENTTSMSVIVFT